MPTTSDLSRNIILEGVPVAFVVEVYNNGTTTTIVSPDPADTVAAGHYRFLFDTLNQISYKVIRASSSSSDNQFEIALADNHTIVFDKESKKINGLTEAEVSDSSSSGTGLAEITLTLNGADIDSPNYATYEAKLDESENSYFLIMFPNGFTADSKGKNKADGWGYMFGKRSSDIEKTQGNAPTTQTVTFSPEKVPSGWTDFATVIAALDMGDGIKLKPVANNVTLVPPAVTDTADIDKIKAGKLLLKPQTITY